MHTVTSLRHIVAIAVWCMIDIKEKHTINFTISFKYISVFNRIIITIIIFK